ncbi:hypothetical protein Sa4125_36400 [Aureimonas sp. SA4125]|nr:hypothetical protein Sa4125_36400 [Aureimonas sp. SA4125]
MQTDATPSLSPCRSNKGVSLPPMRACNAAYGVDLMGDTIIARGSRLSLRAMPIGAAVEEPTSPDVAKP